MCFLKILWHIWFCRKLDILVNLHVLKCLCDKSVFVFQMAWCQFSVRVITLPCPGIILCVCPANERWRYIVTSPLIGWAHTQNDPCMSRQTVSLGGCQGESREGWLEGPPASYRYGSRSDHQSMSMAASLIINLCMAASLIISPCVWQPVWSSVCVYGSQSDISLCEWEPVWSSVYVYGSQSDHQFVCMGASLIISLCEWEPVWSAVYVYGRQSDHQSVFVWEPVWSSVYVCGGQSDHQSVCVGASLVCLCA